MNKNIADIRRDYALQQLLETDVLPDPIKQFERWWNEAIESEIDEVNAMTLATASRDGIPSARIVLLKSFDERGFVFFTNYKSHKGGQLEENPYACLVFFWKELERQVRITGSVQKISAAESDTYFKSRPEGSRIGAWASPQSQPIENRRWLDDHYSRLEKEMAGMAIPRPPHWGGYLVKPLRIEFWQGRPSRLHDRLCYELHDSGEWTIERLAP
ncbi:MAG TPA: pyridoxamine 5'-phosphate oxidase [Chitinophagaceae bacterium]|jgi:pyridoxamine 5'-phosphate oxidase|nr:pyridoxamine 5'-phosphate oxidase [Chitinophagaceae bacterium]